MKTNVLTLDAKKSGDVELNDAIFGIDPRADILHRVVNWQLAKRRSGTHAVKFRSLRLPVQVRVLVVKKVVVLPVTVPVVPTSLLVVAVHLVLSRVIMAHNLPKKIRALGLKSALSAKQLR